MMTLIWKPILKERYSRGVSLAITAAVCPLALLASAFPAYVIMAALFIGMTGGGTPSRSAETIVFTICLLILFAGTYLLSRIVYHKCRWRVVEDDGKTCMHCDYDLTGNTSGVCPECGNPIDSTLPQPD